MIYTTFHVLVGASLVAAALTIFTARARSRNDQTQKDNWVRLANGYYAMDFESKRKKSKTDHFFEKDEVLVSLYFLFWIAMGALFAHVKWDATLIEGVYFAITAVSTGGFLAPELDDTSMWFTGFFVLIGVPIFGQALGILAEVFIII